MIRVGWVVVWGIGCGNAATECASVSPEDCAATAGCAPVSGWPVADDGAGGACVDLGAESVALGCMSDDLGCDTVITNAERSDGTAYVFPSSCLPEGFVPISVSTPPDCT